MVNAAYDWCSEPADVRASPRQACPTLPHVEIWTFKGAGHLPHVTHPSAYVETTTTFIHRHDPKLL
jgi:pimeloyl-ACP methyl ester carboxylesterase